MGHDQTFKDLLSPFFYDFLKLFLPQIAEGVDPTSITPLPTEVFTDIPEGEQRTGAVLVQVTPLGGLPELVFIHTEVQGKEGPELSYRMWEYNALYTLRYKRPVISVELAPFARPHRRVETLHADLVRARVHLPGVLAHPAGRPERRAFSGRRTGIGRRLGRSDAGPVRRSRGSAPGLAGAERGQRAR